MRGPVGVANHRVRSGRVGHSDLLSIGVERRLSDPIAGPFAGPAGDDPGKKKEGVLGPFSTNSNGGYLSEVSHRTRSDSARRRRWWHTLSPIPRAFATSASSTSPIRMAPISLASAAPITRSGCPYGRGGAAETG